MSAVLKRTSAPEAVNGMEVGAGRSFDIFRVQKGRTRVDLLDLRAFLPD